MDLYRLPPAEFPHLRAVAPLLEDYDGASELDEGLSILLRGLTARMNQNS
jgi:hypothetical protein